MLERFAKKIGYDDPLEVYLSKLQALVYGDYPLSRRSIALLLLQEDKDVLDLIKDKEKERLDEILKIVGEAGAHYSHPLTYIIGQRRQEEANRICDAAISFKERQRVTLRERLSKVLMNPFTGGPILLFVLYYGLYKFVGTFGAGVLVDFMEDKVFGEYISPFMINLVKSTLPFKLLQDLLIGEYGIITLGVRYAMAIILPIVATFFFAFAVVEDTGYLPRLAMLIDQLFKKIGLSGRAVIPMVLGLGCDTMATMVTRTLPTKRERIIATLLLALAIPCSAQMGVILALLGDNPLGLVVWLGVIILVFLVVGFLAAKIMPGELPTFYMEIPPLRLPHLSNILRKTYSRLRWYFWEILPLFIFASVFIWLGQITGIFNVLVRILEHPVRWIGLPSEAGVAFLFGFFRRDYGAAGLYDLKKAGLLSGNQLVVASVTLTLFLPCIAQLLMNIKERGMRMGMVMSVFILWFSFTVGYLLNIILTLLNLQL
ncbi:MAG: ferrous iron transporter B [Candidatus Omnitrophica bacterium]|nr:ferrous iron transporter B [Candidatus Omnitrophota bacterium]MDD5553211.1 ferrous iron transporter B [Candidatus Omnitrophota bacterium]